MTSKREGKVNWSSQAKSCRNLTRKAGCSMAEAPQTLEGWYVLHDFRQVHWPSWRELNVDDQRKLHQEIKRDFLGPIQQHDAAKGHSALFAIGGHKADLLFLHLRPTFDELLQLELTLNHTRISDYLEQPFSFVSITELGQYTGGSDNQADMSPRQQAFIQRRLYPQQAEFRYISFYPMSKRQDAGNNWYTLPIEERKRLLYEQGLIGRKHSGEVQQMISGAIGLDDWEWGVTLYSNDPLSLKKVIQEIRFDETSAKYAELGPTFVGRRLQQEELFDFLTGKLASTL